LYSHDNYFNFKFVIYKLSTNKSEVEKSLR